MKILLKISAITVLMFMTAFIYGQIGGFPLKQTLSAQENAAGYAEQIFKEKGLTLKDGYVFKQGMPTGRLVFTSPAADDISGYGGPIPMVIGIDTQNVIIDILPLENTETPHFFEQVISSGFLKNWIGKNISDAYVHDVDDVSGATMSSSAIKDSIHLVLGNMLQQEASPSSAGKALEGCCLLLLFLAALGCYFYPQKLKQLRFPVLLSAVFIMGFWQGNMLSVTKIASWLINGIPETWQWILFIVFATSIFLPIFTRKNFYCFYLCPFGALQEAAGKCCRQKLRFRKVLAGLEYFRLAVLIMCAGLFFAGSWVNIASLEPFSAFKPEYAPVSAIVIFIASLFFALFIPRPWCRFFCPCGAFLDLFKSQTDQKKLFRF